MDDGIYIGPRLVDFSMYPPFVVQFLPGMANRVVVQVVLDNIVCGDQSRSKRS